MPTDDLLATLKRLDAEATPGPWEVFAELNLKAPDPRGKTMCPLTNSWLDEQRKANYRMIAETRNALPGLIAALERLAAIECQTIQPPDPARMADYLAKNSKPLSADSSNKVSRAMGGETK